MNASISTADTVTFTGFGLLPPFAAPQHAYTRALLSSIPVPDPDAPRQRVVLDPASVNRDAALREIAAGHWAAL